MKYNFNGFTQKAGEALNQAIGSACNLGHTYIGSEHLLLGLLKVPNSVAATVMNKNGVAADMIEEKIKESIGIGTPTILTPDQLTPRAKKVIEVSVTGCKNLDKKLVGTEHILIAILSDGDNYAIRFLKQLGVDIAFLTSAALKASGIDVEDVNGQEYNAPKRKNSKGGDKNSTLAKFGRDLTLDAKSGKLDPVIGRSAEIDRVIQILCRRTKNNPCLIGEPGVGKTAIAEGLAQKIAEGSVPEILKGKCIFSLDLTGMVAGTKYRGDFEERIKTVIEEVQKDKSIILFIDEVHNLIGAGAAEGATDAANILKPALSRGEMQLIGATTLTEYRKNIEKDAALERRFQPVIVGEPSESDAVLILKGLKDRYEAHHSVKITDEAIDAAVQLSARYINDRFLPDKAIDLIDEAGSKVRLRNTEQPEEIRQIREQIEQLESDKNNAIEQQDFETAARLRDKERQLKEQLTDREDEWKKNNAHHSGVVMAEEIAEIVSEWTGVPVTRLTEEESERLLTMEDVLHGRIVGQDEAVTALAKAIRRGRVGLQDPNRPIGSFIFLGPTGVGKTELCKALAESLFGSENAIVRLDMSEYMEKHTVSRLIGSPPGYVGFDEGGQLTEKVRRNPYSVILFDEIEKAHPDVFNILLQILDDGALTDSQGRRVNFKNTVIIMTSNIGARLITEKKQAFGFGDASNNVEMDYNTIKESVTAELKKAFRPEFLNRVDDIVVFRKLGRPEIEQISEKLLNNLKKRLLKLDIEINFDTSVVARVAEKGFDDIYGARPLRREIQNSVENLISEKILDGSIKSGDKLICSYDGEYKFNTK